MIPAIGGVTIHRLNTLSPLEYVMVAAAAQAIMSNSGSRGGEDLLLSSVDSNMSNNFLVGTIPLSYGTGMCILPCVREAKTLIRMRTLQGESLIITLIASK